MVEFHVTVRCMDQLLFVAVLFTVIMLKMLFVPGPISIGTLIALGMGILLSLGFSLPKFGKTHK